MAASGPTRFQVAEAEREALERARLRRLKETNDRLSGTGLRRRPFTLAGETGPPAAGTVVRQSLLGGAGDSESLLAGG